MYNDVFNILPLKKAVNAAIVDTHEQASRVEWRYYHWGVRVLRDLCRRALKSKAVDAVCPVSASTKTFELPADFREPIWVGFVDECGEKVTIPVGDTFIIDTADTDDCCKTCGQKKTVCDFLNTETKTETVNGKTVVTKTTELKDGGILLEVTYNIYDAKNKCNVITDRYVVNVDRDETCGCPTPTPVQARQITACCPWMYHLYWGDCCEEKCDVTVTWFPEKGFAKINGNPKFNYVLLKYRGDIPKIHGEYAMPEVALEAVVDGIKLYNSQDKKRVPAVEKERLRRNYRESVSTMKRNMGPRLTIADIYEIARTPPTP